MFFGYSIILLLALSMETMASQVPISVERCKEKAIDTWTALDTARAIAQEDRRYFYRDLVKANLDLYATIYWFSEHHNETSPAVYKEMDQLLSAVAACQQDIFGIPKTHEEAFLNVILQETVGLWDKFRFKCTRQY